MKKNIFLFFISIIIFTPLFVNADTIYLTINNENLTSQRSDGLWGKIELTQGSDYQVNFHIDPFEDAFYSIGNNFGIQTFGFNIKKSDININISNLPTGWNIDLNQNLDGFGWFMLSTSGTGQNRQNPLTFSVISTSQISVSDFIVNNDAGYPFAVHIANFIISGSDKTSAWFSVPEPGVLILLGLGLTAVGIGSRWMRRK